MPKYKNISVAVIMGGISTEREVSLRSGRAITEALRSGGYTVFDTVSDSNDLAVLKGLSPDVVFIAIHGGYGEDGRLQKLLEDAGLPYTGSGPDASLAAMDKSVTKDRFLAAGVPTAPYMVVDSASVSADAVFTRLGPRVVAKPLCQGSSVGVGIVDRSGFDSGLRAALAYDGKAIIESFVKGRELTVAILDDKALPIIEMHPLRSFYDYTAKYTKGQTEYIVNPDLPAETAARVSAAALEAFRSLGCRDWSRVDVMLSERNDVYVLEVNTVPGCTELSLVPRAAKAAGYSFPDMCSRLVEMALERSTAGKTA